MAEKGRVITGARGRLSINGIKVGYATNVSMQEEIEYQDAECLDNIEVEEIVPVAYRVSGSASSIRLVGETPKSQGYFPTSGISPEEHLQNILLQDDLVMTLEDSKTGTLLATLEQVKVASQGFSMGARGMVGVDVQYKAVRLRDESEV